MSGIRRNQTMRYQTMRYETQAALEMPAEVSLTGDSLTGEMLAWDVDCGVLGLKEDRLVSRPVEGCLKEFVRLADAAPDQALAFAQRRGVLGLIPLVWEKAKNPLETQRHYKEPVFVYRQGARIARNILSVMAGLRSKEKVEPERVRQCFSTADGYQMTLEASRDNLYHALLLAVSYWSECAAFQHPLSDQEARLSGRLRPQFVISFGRWADGEAWDRQRLNRYLSGDRLGPWRQGSASVGEARPYAEWAKEEAAGLPRIIQRPSPLFNVLTHQLQREIMLPEGGRLCEQCGGDVLHDKDDPDARKPRSDKPAFCSAACREARRYETERERDRKRRPGKGKTE